MTSVTALEWTPEGLTTSIVTPQLLVAPHGVFKTLGNISDVNKRGELFSSYEARRVGTAIPGNDGNQIQN